MFAHRESDMAGCKEEDPIAFATFTEVKTASALKMGEGFGSNVYTEHGSKWSLKIGGWVIDNGIDWVPGRFVVEELWTSESGEDGLAEWDLDTGDLKLLENMLASYCRVLGILARECLGHHAYPYEKGSSILVNLGEANWVNTRPFDANSIKIFIYLST